MKINFVLVASGSLKVERLNHAIFVDDAERAKTEAAKVVSSLAAADYFTFDLYDVRNDEGHVSIASFRVEVPAPVVTMK